MWVACARSAFNFYDRIPNTISVLIVSCMISLDYISSNRRAHNRGDRTKVVSSPQEVRPRC
jgi:hypothetical protein